MKEIPRFLELDEILQFHAEEIKRSGGAKGIRDLNALKSALGAPQAAFGGKFLFNIFEMAAAYVNSISLDHPFLDGNKRAAAVSALIFLYLNGYELNEKYDEELADKILDLVNKRISKIDLAHYFEKNCCKIE
jgi:death on curing protein